MRAAVLVALLLAQEERSGPPVKQTVRKGDLGPWRYEDFREVYHRSDALFRRRQPFFGVSYSAARFRYEVMQGQSVFQHRAKPWWLVHNFYCTQPAMAAEVPWDCEATVFVLREAVPDETAPAGRRQEDGFTLVNEEDMVEIDGDFEAIEPHPSLPLFAAMRYGCCDSPVRVSVHHFDGRTLCNVRDLALSYLAWGGEPWEKIAADAEAVSCPDGIRVLLADTRAVEPLGAFNDFRHTQGHQDGYGVELWRSGDQLVGFLLVAQGLEGDTPTGLIEDASFDAKTGRLSFGARLTTGRHGCRRHRDVASRELYRFEGTLRSDRLRGVLTRTDALHPGEPPRTERLLLRPAPSLQTFAGVAGWQQHAEWILDLRGPRW